MSNRTAQQRMAAQAFPDEERLRRMVPEAERARSLHRILGDRGLHRVPDPAPRGRRWAPVLGVGVVVVAVLAAVAVFVLPGPVGERPLPEVAGPAPAPFLTTGTDPAEVLGQLADRAAAQPPLPAKPFDYLRTISWTPISDADGRQIPGGKEERQEHEFWVNADGLGRQRIWGEGLGDEVVDSGAHDPIGILLAPRATDLPTDPAALEAALLAIRTDPWDVSHLYDLMSRTWHSQVLEPQVQAAFLRLLATKDDVRVLGPATDRIGRQGVAVTLTQVFVPPGNPPVGPPVTITHTLILDPQTGALLADERVEVDDKGLPTQRLASAWLATGRVGSIDERP